MFSEDPRRILVVDDNRVNRLVLEKRLEDEGYEVRSASGGEEAIEALGLNWEAGAGGAGAEAIDAVVLDIMMPEIDGMEVLRRLRDVKSANELPVIMATAKDQSADIVKALERGANDYVVKPIDMPVLLARLRTQVSLRRTHLALKEAQQALIEAAKMESVGYLAAGVAHEVRNPLAQIHLGMEAIRQMEAFQSDEQSAPILQLVMDAVQQADAIIEELMKVSTSGQLDLEPGSVNELIGEVLKSVEEESDKFGVVVETDLAEELPPVPLAPAEMRAAFSSFVTNAIEAMPDGGCLEVRTRIGSAAGIGPDEGSRSGRRLRKGDECVVVEFKDDGSGIEKEKLQAIFDPFFTTKATGQGTGLGLSVAKKVVEMHQGTLSVENRNDRSGVSVTLQLPKASSMQTTV